MSNNKQTAVEWLIDELSKFEKGESEYFSTTIIKNKAIRMEKQQQDLLNECENQLEYLNQKFGETGTTNALLAKLKNK